MKHFILFIFLIFSAPALAQEMSIGKSDEPLEITADESLEWHRTEKVFIAKKNAVATQGEANIAAQKLTAHYREDAKGDMEIAKLTADDQVTIKSNETTAHGQKAVYDLDSGLATMTGDNLKMVGPDQTVTAQDRFEYWINDGRLSAIGRAKVTRLEDTVEANKVSATFKESAAGERVLDSMEAIGNVVITTPTEVITGAYGIYHAETNIAELSGGVQIKRGLNILEGEKAQVNLNTNISKMFGSAQNGGRVRGVFYPGSEEKPAVSN
ncbi:MAG: hypothetical protein DHS20C02_13660 [Micavibrio sp.]|nr:MAG: hypothetical protein DHS20C02_13660 [Micavibrio sp.]